MPRGGGGGIHPTGAHAPHSDTCILIEDTGTPTEDTGTPQRTHAPHRGHRYPTGDTCTPQGEQVPHRGHRYPHRGHMHTAGAHATPTGEVSTENVRIQLCNKKKTCLIYIYISLPYFMFGRALSWGSAFAVCIVHCSLVYQFEHSGKVRRAWFKFGFENFYSSLLSGSASFLCAALMSPQRTKQYCPQIEYI